MGRIAFLLVISCVFTAHAESADAFEQATWLHAKAQGRELDGQKVEALALMRQAGDLAPDDLNIQFDLARLSFEQKDPGLQNDARHFLEMGAQSQDEKVLRAYILTALGQTEAARSEVNAMSDPAGEALQLRRLLAREPSPEGGAAAFSATLSAGAEVDTNVLVLPQDAASQQGGARATLNGGLTFRPVQKDVGQVLLSATVRSGTHVSNRAVLQAYDTLAWGLSVGGKLRLEGWTLHAGLEGSSIHVDDVRQTFLRQGLIDLQATHQTTDTLRLGGYANAGLRDFIAGNVAGPYDRDGSVGEAGLTALWQRGGAQALGRAGYQTEMTSGRQMHESGPSALLAGGYTYGRLTAIATLGYQMRRHTLSSDGRLDNRLVPGARIALDVVEHTQAVAAYTFTDNRSTAGTYAYRRHLASLGVEARW